MLIESADRHDDTRVLSEDPSDRRLRQLVDSI